MMIWMVLLGLLLTSSGCAEPPGGGLSWRQRSEPVVILVPGYYGSRLARVSDRSVFWVSALQGLGGFHSLTLPLADLALDGPRLKADGILEAVPIVPGLYSIDGYGAILEALRADGVRVVPLDYDWREDLPASVRRLHEVVTQLRGEGVTDLAIVAHSMGGLIAAYYVRYGAQDPDRAVETWEGAEQIDALVLAGVPFRGTMTAFRNMTYGRSVGWNTTLLSFQAIASFPSTFYLLPQGETDRLLLEDGSAREGLIGDPDNWRRFRWGLLRGADALSNQVRARRADYTAAWLRRAQRFHRLLEAPPSRLPKRPLRACASITGRGEPTLATGVLRPRHTGRASILFDSDGIPLPETIDRARLFADGDGSVTMESAALPQAFVRSLAVRPQIYDAEHGALINRDDIRRDLLRMLRGHQRERAS